jgi:hypothetical protein
LFCLERNLRGEERRAQETVISGGRAKKGELVWGYNKKPREGEPHGVWFQQSKWSILLNAAEISSETTVYVLWLLCREAISHLCESSFMKGWGRSHSGVSSTPL